DQSLRNASNKVFSEVDKMLCIWHIIEQNLKTNCHRLFDSNDDYEVFKNKVEALHLTFDEKKIELAMESVKQAAKKAHNQKKSLTYIESLMKDSKL
ncbi:12086_t:CDS:1, partial [Cetraspora pellucida]